MDQMELSNIFSDGHTIRLTGAISSLLTNPKTGQLLDNVRLYQLKKSKISYRSYTLRANGEMGEDIPALYKDGELLVNGLEYDGFRVTKSEQEPIPWI